MIIYTLARLNHLGTEYALGYEGFGYGINNIIAGVIEVTSFVYLSFLVHKIPRRCGMAGFYIVVALLGILITLPQVKHNFVLLSIVLGVSRVFSSAAFILLSCMQT